MKKILLLFSILITLQSTCSFAQKYSSIDSVPGAPVFNFTHHTALEIVKDKKFIAINAKIFLDFANKILVQNQLDTTTRDYRVFLMGGIEIANLILGNYQAAEKFVNIQLAEDPSDFNFLYYLPDKVFIDVKKGKASSYSLAILSEIKVRDRECLELYDDYYYGPGMLSYPQTISNTAFGFLSSDTANFRKNIARNTTALTKIKKLSMMQFGDFLYVYGENMVADAVAKDFTNTTPFDHEKWDSTWNSMLYHFTKKDSLHDVLACNYSVFYSDLFDPKILWNNPGEIPGNHIDDDNNGIVDDVYGYEYKIDNQKIKEPVALSWEETDSIAVLKEPFDSVEYKDPVQSYKHILEHGSMTVELMLKDNPSIHFMALEQHADDFKRLFPSMFTADVMHNQYLVDSFIDLLVNSFQEEATYCNRYKVRVVVINGMMEAKDLYFKECGHDNTEAKAFEQKMENKFKQGYAIAYGKAPNTLYINSAGNSNLNIDIDSMKQMINFLHLPNIIVAGSLYKDLHKSYDSNYGSKVDVFAPAHFPLKLANSNSTPGYHNESAGTSASAPVIANLAIQILELNSNLTAVQVKQLIIEGADKEPYEKGINIINPKKTIALVKKGCCF